MTVLLRIRNFGATTILILIFGTLRVDFKYNFKELRILTSLSKGRGAKSKAFGGGWFQFLRTFTWIEHKRCCVVYLSGLREGDHLFIKLLFNIDF